MIYGYFNQYYNVHFARYLARYLAYSLSSSLSIHFLDNSNIRNQPIHTLTLYNQAMHLLDGKKQLEKTALFILLLLLHAENIYATH